MKNGKYRKGIFVVLFRREKNIFGKKKIKYLLFKRKLHWKGWEFCKGGVEKNEKILDAVKREVFEETGFRINSREIIDFRISGKYKYSKEFKDRPGFVGQSYRLFAVDVSDCVNKNKSKKGSKKSQKVKVDKKEHSSFKWVDFRKAMGMLTFVNQKKSLEKVDKVFSEKSGVRR